MAMECGRAIKILERYYRQGSTRDISEVQGHVESCPLCFERFKPISLLLPPLEGGAGIAAKEKRKPRMVAVFAGVSCFVVLLVLVYVVASLGYVPGTKLVTFSLSSVEARSVTVVGDFNDWNVNSHPMTLNHRRWSARIPVKTGKVYSYNFVLDGVRWMTDPKNMKSVEDGFGGKSSLLEL